jgi:hypothetical protein
MRSTRQPFSNDTADESGPDALWDRAIGLPVEAANSQLSVIQRFNVLCDRSQLRI